MTDHDAIAARVRHSRDTGGPYAWQPDLSSAYLDLYDEVKRLRAERDDWMSARNDAVRARMTAEAERDALAHMLDLSKRTTEAVIDRAEKAEAERDRLRTQCCMCGKTGLSTIEDGGPECELDDGRWVCSVDCYDLAVLNHLVAEAERDRLRAALNEIATAASGIAHDLQIGPDDEGRDIHEMALAIRDDARAALKGDSDE